MWTVNTLRKHSGWKRLRPFFTVRFVLAVIVLVLLLSAGQRFAGALFIPPGSIQKLVSASINDWTGYRIVVRGTTERSFWPTAYITLEDVEIFPADINSSQPLMTVKQVTGNFDVLSALRGRPIINSVLLDSPEFYVVRHDDGTLNWHPEGKLASLRKGSANADLTGSQLSDFQIDSGTVHFIQDGKSEIQITGLDGTFNWRSLNSPASFNLQGELGNKPVHFIGSSSEAAQLLLGNGGQFTLAVKSAVANASFSGKANFDLHPYMAGDFNADITDAPSTAEWIGLELPAVRALKAISLQAAISSEGTRFNLSNLTMKLDNSQATGFLEGGWQGEKSLPYLSGTLAFDKFDMSGFLSAFVLRKGNLLNVLSPLDPAFMRQFQLDLRLSASNATLAGIPLTDVAASARIDQGFASFAVATSQFGKGNIAGELTLKDQSSNNQNCSLHLQVRDIDLGALRDQFSIKGPWPQALATGSVDLAANVPFSPFGHLELNGSMDLETGAGELNGFDPVAFRTLAEKKNFFDLDQAGGSPLEFTSLKFKANVENGIAELTQADFTGTDNSLQLSGIIPYKNSSLALVGTLSAPASQQTPTERFFAGGAWPNIVISPVSTLTRGQQ